MTDEKLMTLAVACLAAIIIGICTGCTPNRGWRFEIGVSPVSNLENKAGLTDKERVVKGY